MARFDYTIHHVPGKLLCTADALSRKPTLEALVPDPLEEEVKGFENGLQQSQRILPSWLATSEAHASRPCPILER